MSDQTDDPRNTRIQEIRAVLLQHDTPVIAAAAMLCNLEQELQIAYQTVEALEALLRHHAMTQEVSGGS